VSTSPENMAKLTPHFLEKWSTDEALECKSLIDVLKSGALNTLAQTLRRNDRGAVAIGSQWVIFKLDSGDPGRVALLTALSGDEVKTIGRRRDTHVMRLPGEAT